MNNNETMKVDPSFVVEQYKIKTNELMEQNMFALAMVNQLNQQLKEALKSGSDKDERLSQIQEEMGQLTAELEHYRGQQQ